jgi:hypothetical protein
MTLPHFTVTGRAQSEVYSMRGIAFATLLIAVLAGTATAQEAARIGTIKTLKGNARVIGSGSAAAAVGGAVHQNDTLETGPDDAVGVTFIDNTTLSMGPNSRITLTKIVFNPDRGDFAFATDIAKGTFMFVSGSIAKLAPQSVKIGTPVSTIGIRGTRFLVKIEE